MTWHSSGILTWVATDLYAIWRNALGVFWQPLGTTNRLGFFRSGCCEITQMRWRVSPVFAYSASQLLRKWKTNCKCMDLPSLFASALLQSCKVAFRVAQSGPEVSWRTEYHREKRWNRIYFINSYCLQDICTKLQQTLATISAPRRNDNGWQYLRKMERSCERWIKHVDSGGSCVKAHKYCMKSWKYGWRRLRWDVYTGRPGVFVMIRT